MLDVSSSAVAKQFDGAIVAYENYQYDSEENKESVRRIYGNIGEFEPYNIELVKNKINLGFGLVSTHYRHKQLSLNHFADKEYRTDSRLLVDLVFDRFCYKMRPATPFELHELQQGSLSKEIFIGCIINESDWKKSKEISINHYFNKYKIFHLINLDNSSHIKLPKELIFSILGMALTAE